MTTHQPSSSFWQDEELDEYAANMQGIVLRLDLDKSNLYTLSGLLTALRRDRPIVFVRAANEDMPYIEDALDLAGYSRTGNRFEASGAIEFSA